MWLQRQLTLKARSRGFHLVTEEILAQLPEVAELQVGLLHLWLQHTSASLTINENADPLVRSDFEAFFRRLVPENQSYYQHTYEGADDLPAHVKASILGMGCSVPISQGRLALGTWQGIYLGEHREQGGRRRLLVTLQGE
ncbi:secondary thiamine-phosphate synthase enzyme YjbQ [Balneatrix alpica]|uniref:Secondary thiamine-phosphate synthase enzyme YjbQ n=1 Tax=Balneatrix alpica TaxID=75684 RepID=A0ABV5ZAV6_9GAMM|nr:secondary thiamine-phosphate synthase enzyme YjbQ [Balneatrix alpica]